MFTKVLIANRGAIAVRIIRTLKRLGVTSVAVYAEADRDSLHVSQADFAISLGEGNAAATYLNQDKLFAIASATGAEAIHPGYGFLSENAEFAQRCELERVVFLGPRPEQMLEFGLKHRARELAQQCQVPLLPGSELLSDLAAASAAAEQIGFPVMLKSTAGGGGIGMSRCNDQAALAAAFESVKRLSGNNFGNSGVFLEKFITRARHIEVQVFGDGEGNAVTLGERDCSAQRRNQKVIEETPAPNIPAPVREELAAVARRLASSVNYRSAGTVEFIYDSDSDQFYFLEVNTRLQVEHGVTEQVYGVDLVEWMVKLGAAELAPLAELAKDLQPRGHSIQARIYAEDTNKDFQPCAGLLTQVEFPQLSPTLRIDHWVEAGIEVTPFFDPMLAKIIATGSDRQQALQQLAQALADTRIYGIETNIDYVRHVLEQPQFEQGEITTNALNSLQLIPATIDVLSSGTQTTIQDYPGRSGYWHVGIPPSGPFDSVSFRLGNQLLGNAADAAGLEITLNGPTLKFNQPARVVIAGADIDARISSGSTGHSSGSRTLENWQVADIAAGDVLTLGAINGPGSRAYLLLEGGLDCPQYLGSRATFTLGQFGGHGGRALRTGDVLHCAARPDSSQSGNNADRLPCLPAAARPQLSSEWQLRVIYGPHGAADFFTPEDIETFFATPWEVHYNSSRTGVRLLGPKPVWARSDGGEAGMHPSNIHDNAYAVGAVDFTGDMPVILGPDGPSLGGFVCPATVVSADLWKLGQLRAGDKVRFLPIALQDAVALERDQLDSLNRLQLESFQPAMLQPDSCIVKELPAKLNEAGKELPKIVYRLQGDHYLLIEYGPLQLDIKLRFRVHALMLWLQDNTLPGLRELTPGVRSLQVHYDSQTLDLDTLLAHLETAEDALDHSADPEVPARIVHIPLSWDDEACRIAIQKYMQSVRKDAPWCPSNIEFIRRINGLDSIDEVKKIVFDASYLVLGLGDVYLGAPVATPIDPRHRLVTTKYNPARTWTAENSVGIGGSYMCVYGMEGPGGYQFVGRTLQMWNRFHKTAAFSQPWLLRFFDQIRFYEVSAEELVAIRKDFPKGQYPVKIEETVFNLGEYEGFLRDNQASIADFTQRRERAFATELQHWIESGQMNFEQSLAAEKTAQEFDLPEGGQAVESHVAGSVWQIAVQPGQTVNSGDLLLVIESMKMEIEVHAPCAGTVHQILKQEGDQVSSGDPLLTIAVQD
ncbi:urea carboxylase [Pseudomaricurvus alcaniphilus]|uniref:urea carboxylase n=1 Tax=Pseudomaricurvus alcaniphilus TaxID=1166482 RepID=UPI00140D120F|nr:urea carboxylase [Pseudomaricurvus alcaniphilus]